MRVNFKEFASRRKFGVELELSATKTREEIKEIVLSYDHLHQAAATTGSGSSGWADTQRNDYWHIKYDSTCGPLGKKKDHGWEIASYIAAGMEDVDNISGLSHYLGTHGLEVNKNCGLHIHAEVKDLSSRDMGSLLARWVKIESWLYAACPSRRSMSVYCRSLRVRMKDKCVYYNSDRPDDFWYGMMPLDTSVHNNSEKKYSLNTVGYAIGQINPLYPRVTAELRLPECELDREHVRNWTLLFLNFVDTCGYAIFAPQSTDVCDNIQDALSVLGLGRSPNGAFQILDHTLFGVKVWFLKRLIRYSQDENLKEQAQDHLEFITRV